MRLKQTPRLDVHWLLLASLILVTILSFFSVPVLWNYTLGPVREGQSAGALFADMHARLEIADGVAHGIDVNHEQNPYSRSTALNNKPLFTVHTMAFLSLGTDDSMRMGIFFAAIFILSSCILLRPANWLEACGMYLVTLSPPSLLLIYRGNDDIIIFAFLIVVPYLLSTRNVLTKSLGWCLISFVTPMKYYPAAVYALFLHRFKSVKALCASLGASTVFLAVLFLLIQDELQVSSERIPEPSRNFSFGSKLIFQSLEFSPGQQVLFSLIGLALILLIVLAVFISRDVESPEINSSAGHYFLLGSSVLVFCFIMNSNWDYRLGFAIPTLPFTFQLLKSQARLLKGMAAFYLLATLLTLWPEYLFFYSCYDPSANDWSFNTNAYINTLHLKHIASWGMMGGCTILSALILRDDIRRLYSETVGAWLSAQSN